LAQLDFATGLLQTQPRAPVMYAEFQAGWLQGAGEGAPRPSDPSNTALALGELLRDGVHGIVNFPVQDTVYPAGWEAPWANWSYAWDAALTSDLQPAPRSVPTSAFGDDVRRYGTLLARTHADSDAGIIWPPSLFSSLALDNRDFRAFADATIAMQRDCNARGLSCQLVDLAYANDELLERYPRLVLPIVLTPRLRAAMVAPVARTFARLQRRARLADNVASPDSRPQLAAAASGVTLLRADDNSYAFVEAVNPSPVGRTIGPLRVQLSSGSVGVASFTLAPRSQRLVPVGLPVPAADVHAGLSALATPPPFTGDDVQTLDNSRLRVAFAPNAGARISGFTADGVDNAASSIGLLRDGVFPEPAISPRDYIAAYTHPLPAGTFNRAYGCDIATATVDASSVSCEYDAPDLPTGGARFSRTLTLGNNDDELAIEESFAPADPAPTANLESISGFAFHTGDLLIAPDGAEFVGILHGHRLAALRWRSGDVTHVTLKQTRGAELVTLLFARSPVELRLGIYQAADAAEALRLLQANWR
jgi:hypothetical protein